MPTYSQKNADLANDDILFLTCIYFKFCICFKLIKVISKVLATSTLIYATFVYNIITCSTIRNKNIIWYYIIYYIMFKIDYKKIHEKSLILREPNVLCFLTNLTKVDPITAGGDCHTRQFFGPSGVIAVISSFFRFFVFLVL